MTQVIRRGAMAALILALLGGLAAISPGPLYKADLVALGGAFWTLRQAALLCIAAAALAGLLIVAGLFRGVPWRTGLALLVAFAIGTGTADTIAGMREKAARNPIHDVTSDVDDPPQFALLSPRTYDDGSRAGRAAHPHPHWRLAHRYLYADIDTVTLATDPAETLKAVRAAAEAMGWQIAGTRQAAGRQYLEATATTGWFGFTDQLVIRLAPGEAGTAVDIRSVSQIGVSDLGANAERVRTFFEQLDRQTTPS